MQRNNNDKLVSFDSAELLAIVTSHDDGPKDATEGTQPLINGLIEKVRWPKSLGSPVAFCGVPIRR